MTDADDVLVITDTPAPTTAPVIRKLPAPHFCSDRLFSLAEYLSWQYQEHDHSKLVRAAAIEIKGLRQAIREAAQGVKALEQENRRLKDKVARMEGSSECDDARLAALTQEIARMGEMWRDAEFDGEPT